MDSIVRELITEYTAKGMTLVDILEKQIEPGHPAREFIRVYKSMYPSPVFERPSPIKELQPTQPRVVCGPIHRQAIHGKGLPKVFACLNGYFDLVKCQFIQTPTTDVKELSSKNIYPPDRYDMQYYYDCQSGLTEYLAQIFPDPEVREYVLNIYADSLDGVRRRKEFFIHIGSGSNSKSVFQNLLQHTFGDYYKLADTIPYLGSINPDIRIITFHSPQVGTSVNSEAIKDISKYHNARLMCNTSPELDNPDADNFRRIRVINYPSKFVARQSSTLREPAKYPNHYPCDYNIHEKVKIWAPYFLEMLFERYKILKANEFKSLDDDHIPTAILEAYDLI